jgi:GT2 family glycosyltransferase
LHSVRVTVVVPTLAGDPRLLECLASLEAQTLPDVQVVVVDNSGTGAIHRLGAARFRFRLIENRANVGFGAAVNQGWRLAPSEFCAVLNDDAIADAGWLESLVGALEQRPGAGMAASRIVAPDGKALDSAGMLIARDGSSKQRGHGESPERYAAGEDVLLPSGCAALYRRSMLEQTGLFEEEFFLYCEDTDLGLRGRWAGWGCVYVPEARVVHAYSQSSGAASEKKAWFVERNRLRLCVRCLPLPWLAASPFWSVARYAWHLVAMAQGHGKAAEFRESGGAGWRLPWLVLKAHWELLTALPRLLRQRAAIARTRRIEAGEFAALLRAHSISLRSIASL